MKAILMACALAAALIALPGSPRTQARAATGQPNIIIFLTDDQEIGTLAAMPNVRDRLAARGRVYRQAFISNPLCCPSRASILTGTYSHTNGVYTNQAGSSSEPWDVYGGLQAFVASGGEGRTIAHDLDPTYDTALFGKYLNGYRRYSTEIGQPGYVPEGWNTWDAFMQNNARYYDYDLSIDGQIRSYGSSARDLSTHVLGRRAVDWLDVSDGDGRNPDEPFFLYFAPAAPHAPSVAASRDLDRFLDLAPLDDPAVHDDLGDKPTYLRLAQPARPTVLLRNRIETFQSLYTLDREIGRMLDALTPAERGNTVFLFMSDNGYAAGEHGWHYKLVPYDRSIRVPFIVRYDGVIPAGTVDARDMVLNIDVKPWLLGEAGVSSSSAVDGVSLADSVRGQDVGPLRSEFLLENMYYPRPNADAVPTYCGIVTRAWKYVVYSPTAAEPGLVVRDHEDELYDRVHDPWELTDVADLEPSVVAGLRARLAALCTPPPPDTTPEWLAAWAG